MQLSDAEVIKKCVVYVGYRKRGSPVIGGTAFFVSYRGHTYLVTAKHNVLSVQNSKAEGFLIRFNRKTGGLGDFETKFSDWKSPEDPFTDVAVLGIKNEIKEHGMDVVPYPADNHVNAKVIAEMPVTVGDEVFFPGLFSHHAGQERNVPVVRSGNIAAMSDEVRVNWFGTKVSTDAYLVEARSLGGLSGSPVFVHFPWRRRYEMSGTKKIIKLVAKETEHCILGLVHGHYDERILTRGNRKMQNINVGMAIVVPFTKVMDLLEREKAPR